MALIVGSILVSLMILYSTSFAIQILKDWNLESGSELQLRLERKTYLISILVSYAFAFEIVSFFLFIFVADQIHTFFVGAMCAAGSLYANSYGYPALIAKIVIFILAGIWLILNHVDVRGYDYPLIKVKCGLLLFLLPLVLFETFLQANYFLRLKPNIITSCCGTLFSAEALILPSGLWFYSNALARVYFYIFLLFAVALAGFYTIKGKGAYLLSVASAVAFGVSVVSFFSFISSYIYELPTHHCPFCVLQKEYGYLGYALYLSLFGAVIAGLGVGVLRPFRNIGSLNKILLPCQKRLALTSAILYSVFAIIVTIEIYLSTLVLNAYL